MKWSTKFGITVVASAAAIALPAVVSSRNSEAGAANRVPPAALTVPSKDRREVAVLAGGCFWGVEAVFEHVRGVADVTSGFAGGDPKAATYSSVSSGTTRHAEAVRIAFDPRQVSYAELLRIFFSVAHDPTQLNRQGPDVGPQYRTAIFPQSAGQARVARAYLAQLGKSGAFSKPIATRIESGRFVAAEAYHQDFMRKNPVHPYVVIHDKPKLAELRRLVPAQWKA
jgi:peptide-methionine (S)-S-oxide reductase